MSGADPPAPPLEPPVPLAQDHELETFNSGVAALDNWLKHRARSNETEGASRTFVCCSGQLVVGYYSLAAGSILHNTATGRTRRNMPNPLPVVLLGRLAVHRDWQGRGIGADLLRDAVMRILAAGQTIGVRAILVNAVSEEAKAFYQKYGFRESPIEPMTLMITLDEAKRMLPSNDA